MADPKESNDSEAFASNVPLTDVFGSHPKTAIIAALLAEPGDPATHFTANEISRISGVDPDVVREHVEDVLVYGIVVETDDLDDEATYKLDDGSDAVAAIRQLSNELSEEMPESDAYE